MVKVEFSPSDTQIPTELLGIIRKPSVLVKINMKIQNYRQKLA